MNRCGGVHETAEAAVLAVDAVEQTTVASGARSISPGSSPFHTTRCGRSAGKTGRLHWRNHARNQELEAENRDLKDKLAFKGKLQFRNNVLWAEGDDHPYCVGCWQKDGNAIYLTHGPDPDYYVCPACNVTYDTKSPRRHQEWTPPNV